MCKLLLTPSPFGRTGCRLCRIIVQELEPGAAVEEPHKRSRWCFGAVSGAVVVVIDRHMWWWTVGTEPLVGPDHGSGRHAVADHGVISTVTEFATVFEHKKRFDVPFVQVIRHVLLAVGVVVAPPLAVHNPLTVELDVFALTNVRGGHVSL